MVSVSKKGEVTTTINESGRILNSLARGRLLRAGVRVPYYIKGDVSYIFFFEFFVYEIRHQNNTEKNYFLATPFYF